MRTERRLTHPFGFHGTLLRAVMTSPAPSQRIVAFDWLRGLAVLFMIQCHAMVLLKTEYAPTPFFRWLIRIDGLVAPAFIFAAGFSLALVQVRGAHAGTRRLRLKKTLRRIVEVLLVATLVNWMWFPIFREPIRLIRLDILHCIGFSLLIALPLLSLLAPRPQVLRWVTLVLAAVVFGISPFFEKTPGVAAYFVNGTREAVFPLLPWAGYVYLGASAGTTGAMSGVKGLVRWLLGLAAAGAVLWFFSKELQALYPPHHFWVTNPANAAQRWTLVIGIVLVFLYLENKRPQWTQNRVFGFITVFGTSSMAAYFFHEALLYYQLFGLGFSFNAWWGGKCDWPKYWLLTAALIATTYGLVLLLEPIYRWADKHVSAWLTPRTGEAK